MKIEIVQFRNGAYGIRRVRWFRYQFLANHLIDDEWRPVNNMRPHRDFEYGSKEILMRRLMNVRGWDSPVDVGEVVPMPISLYTAAPPRHP